MSVTLEGAQSGDPIHDKDNRLLVDSIAVGPLEHASEAPRGDAAYFVSTYTATGGQEVISIKNDESAKKLHITRLFLASTAQTIWTLFETTSATAAGGTALTYQNPNLTSGTNNSVTAFGNAEVTGSLTGNTLGLFSTTAEVMAQIFLEGSLILGKDDQIAITADVNGTVIVTIIGFWDDE